MVGNIVGDGAAGGALEKSGMVSRYSKEEVQSPSVPQLLLN